MRVVLAPDSFKGSASAIEVVQALERGWRRVRPTDDIVALPFADGGEGTLDAVATAVPGAVLHAVRVTGPVDEPVDAHWLELPDGSALVELAEASGLLRLPRDASGTLQHAPLDAHTRGTGEAMRSAIDAGMEHVAVAIGGSASTDGGVGILTALGAVFRDAEGAPVRPGARYLHDIVSVDSSQLITLPRGGISVWTDVTNPLTGPQGAAAVYGPQKGLARGHIPYVEEGLRNLARVLGIPVDVPGAGAAGGVGYGLAWLGARIRGGAAAVAQTIRLESHVNDAAYVITGEGSYDGQTSSGKAVSEVLRIVRDAGVPVGLVAGVIDSDAETSPFDTTLTLTGLARDRARIGERLDPMRDAVPLLERAGALVATSVSRGPEPR